jgi:3-isopropylmalate/(R)-2-methylmalate dehydratase small subunit
MTNDIIQGKIWKFGDNINTDLIIPPAYLTVNDPNQIVQHAFDGIRPGFSKLVNKGDIILAGKNFGSGSSREEAVFVLTQLGISCVIAESFSRIYFRNLINQGIPAISIPAISINNTSKGFKEGDMIQIELKKGTVLNKRTNETLNFKSLPKHIMEIIDNGGALNVVKKILVKTK